MHLDGGPESVLENIDDSSHLPFVLVVGIDVVVLAKLLVKIVAFELVHRFPQHLT
jgi:hypothetical protein